MRKDFISLLPIIFFSLKKYKNDLFLIFLVKLKNPERSFISPFLKMGLSKLFTWFQNKILLLSLKYNPDILFALFSLIVEIYLYLIPFKNKKG